MVRFPPVAVLLLFGPPPPVALLLLLLLLATAMALETPALAASASAATNDLHCSCISSSELLRALRFSCASLCVWASPHSLGDTPPTPPGTSPPGTPAPGYGPAQTSTSATPLSRFSLFVVRVPPRADFCRSSSASMRSVSISSISLIDSRRSSANLHRSCSLRALNVTSTLPSTFCDSRMQN
uniref:Secreted protein n=1 Tax=Anopheles merus TaxID=30066 RepID=A0A182VFQ2_ANOME